MNSPPTGTRPTIFKQLSGNYLVIDLLTQCYGYFLEMFERFLATFWQFHCICPYVSRQCSSNFRINFQLVTYMIDRSEGANASER